MRTFHRGWPRVNTQSGAHDAMTMNFSAGPPYGMQLNNSRPVVASNKVVFMALGTFFGIVFFLFGIQIYVRCVWRRIQTSAILEEDEESEEEMTSRADIYITEIGRRRTWRRRLHHYFDERSESSSRAEHIPVGLDKSVLELLPTFVFNEEAAFRDEMVCAVCLEEFVEEERGRLLPKCSHCFHVQCIDMWFLSHSSCPLCRCEVSLPSSTDTPDTSSDPLLQSSLRCPEFSTNSQQQQPLQDPWPGPYASIMNGLLRISAGGREECPEVVYSPRSAAIISDASSSASVISDSALISGPRDSNFVLHLERGSSLSNTAADIHADISSEVSDDKTECSEENQQVSSSQRGPIEVELVVRRESSSDIPSPGTVPQRRDSPGSVLFLEYQPNLHPCHAGVSLSSERDSTAAASTSRSPHHARKRSYLAVEIIGECHLDSSGAMSQTDTSPSHEVRPQQT